VLEECQDCGHVFQNPRLTPDGLSFYYRDFYDGLGADELDGAFAGGESAYEKRAAIVPREAKPARWLDVGGGHGHFALVARQQWPATEFDLVDQADSVLEAERRGWVAHGIWGTLAELTAAGRPPYDVVSMFHYLEHCRDPGAELDDATQLLAPGGHLVIECPDPDSRWGRLVRGAWGPWLQPQHQHFLSAGAVQRELEARGYEIVTVERAEAHQMGDLTGSLWTAVQWAAPAPDRPWLPRRTPAQRAARVATLVAAGPLLVLALVADAALSPVWPRVPGGPNAYRILAVRPA
jgi:SAM-dependent methyltransferase